jgi:hypothetical protein
MNCKSELIQQFISVDYFSQAQQAFISMNVFRKCVD